jgi:hypothetical protein
LGFVLAVASRRRGGKRCMLAGEAVDKLCPVFFMGASRIQLLREPKSSIVTSGTLANRRRRFLMM